MIAAVQGIFARKLTQDYIAAEEFVKSYYDTLMSHRKSMSLFYSAPSSMPDGKPLPAIVWNGNVVKDAATFQDMFVKEMPPSYYDVQSYDSHVINPKYVSAEDATSQQGSPKNMSMLVTVSGYVKYGEDAEAPMNGFSESFVLVPNPENDSTKGRGKRGKEWLIQSQTFRLVV